MKPMPKKIKFKDNGDTKEYYYEGANNMHDQFTEYLKERCSGIEEIIRNGGSLISNNENYTEDVNHLANQIRKHLGVTDD